MCPTSDGDLFKHPKNNITQAKYVYVNLLNLLSKNRNNSTNKAQQR